MGSTPPAALIGNRIVLIRGRRVMLDSDLALIYGVSTKRLNQQFLRNQDRFPSDFAFQLRAREARALRLHFATSKTGRGGRRYLPYAFTEHGAVMLSAVLKSAVAIRASILVARAFVGMRKALASQSLLHKKLDELERKVTGHDAQIDDLFDAIRGLMDPPKQPPRRIGFQP